GYGGFLVEEITLHLTHYVTLYEFHKLLALYIIYGAIIDTLLDSYMLYIYITYRKLEKAPNGAFSFDVAFYSNPQPSSLFSISSFSSGRSFRNSWINSLDTASLWSVIDSANNSIGD